jgi:hypothetical protein
MAHLTQVWLNGFGYDMLRGLHADLLSKGLCDRERLRLLACHIGKAESTRSILFQACVWGAFQGKCQAFHMNEGEAAFSLGQ